MEKAIEVVINDRIGKKVKIKCLPTDTVYTLKQLVSSYIGTKADKIKLQLSNIVLKDNITLDDYEIKNGSGIELYYS